MQFEDLDPKERQAYVKHRTQANMHMLQSKKAKSSRSKFHLNMAKFHKDAMCELLKLFEADAIIEKLQSVGNPPPKPDPFMTWWAPGGTKTWWAPGGTNIGVVIQQVIAPSRKLKAQWTVEPALTLDIESVGLVWPKN